MKTMRNELKKQKNEHTVLEERLDSLANENKELQTSLLSLGINKVCVSIVHIFNMWCEEKFFFDCRLLGRI